MYLRAKSSNYGGLGRFYGLGEDAAATESVSVETAVSAPEPVTETIVEAAVIADPVPVTAPAPTPASPAPSASDYFNSPTGPLDYSGDPVKNLTEESQTTRRHRRRRRRRRHQQNQTPVYVNYGVPGYPYGYTPPMDYGLRPYPPQQTQYPKTIVIPAKDKGGKNPLSTTLITVVASLALGAFIFAR